MNAEAATVQVEEVQQGDTATLDALMRCVVETSLMLGEDERADVLMNITTNLHTALQSSVS
ncbi:hypothetical protein EHZ19_31115 [Paraburkholderia bannensis]|nr:hypothetical protein [Paraburkholderia bannensis]RQM44005.1 hypothetical protein EHZ19_31115 [Paraburkholderia bannensis]